MSVKITSLTPSNVYALECIDDDRWTITKTTATFDGTPQEAAESFVAFYVSPEAAPLRPSLHAVKRKIVRILRQS